MITVISFNTTFINANAASNLSHSEMSDIYGSGYTNALLETVVEVNAKAATRLEENRDTLTQYYENTKSYINQRIQDYGNVSNFGELLIEQASGAMTLADSVLDLLSNFFKDEITETTPIPTACTLETSDAFLNSGWMARIPSSCPYFIYVKSSDGGQYSSKVLYQGAVTTNPIKYYGYISSGGTRIQSNYTQFKGAYDATPISMPTNLGSLSSAVSHYFEGKGYISTSPNSVPVDFGEQDNRPVFYNNYFKNMKSDPSKIQPVYIPQLQPKLSCPDGDKVVQIDGRGGFVHANGVPVNVDGCTVYWQKPSVTVDDDGKVLLTDPDTGETTDAGVKPPKDKIPVEDKGEGCDSVLCFLGGVTAGIADLISTILGLVGDLLDGLFELVKKIFLPSDNFWSSNLDGLKNKFFHDEIKEVQNGVESLETVGSGQFGDVTGSLMGVDNLTIIDSTSINMSLEKIHSWVRGFFYPLLLFFNINQMYRVIRGTSLIGIGGKKEE